MFTCGNNALVVGDGPAIVKFGFPTNNVKFNDAVYTYECVIFAFQFDAITVVFVLFEKQTRKENKSLVHVPQVTIIKSSPSLFVVPLFEAKFIRNFRAAVLGVGEAHSTDFYRTWTLSCSIRQLSWCV
jgi:hypothetical protein